MPPRELPGFYFDEAKNRYFPSSSKPKPTGKEPSSRPLSAYPSGKVKTKPTRLVSNSGRLQHVFHDLRSSYSSRRRERSKRNILTSQIEAASAPCNCIHIPTVCDDVTAFHISMQNGYFRSAMGDSFGLLSSWDSPVTDRIADISNHLSDWTALYSLGSRVSSICMSKSITAATSFGPRCKIVVQDSARLARDDITVLTPDKKLIYDVWTCDLADRAIVLGMHNRAMYLGDIGNPDKFRALDVDSDVLALHQKQNLVYTGARNGSIRRFDLREGSSGHPVFDDKFTPESANSVIYMDGINESQLLVSTIRGEISLHDLRFSRGMQSIMTFSGHVGSYRHNLPHAISPCQSYLFAAGQDNRIRAWSLITGAQLSSPIPVYTPSRRKAHANPLAARFEGNVTALQILETGKETVLFATSGQRLHIFPLGQYSQIQNRERIDIPP